MALTREIARLSKILVESDGISFPEAEARLRRLTLEIVVGENCGSPAAQAAVLTAVLVGRRTFLGGVRITGMVGQPVVTALPLDASTLADACREMGADGFEGEPSFTITVGDADGGASSVGAYWDGWIAGVRRIGSNGNDCDGTNPLAGIAAGALSVGCAFDRTRGLAVDLPADIDLWGLPRPPAFEEVFLPGSVWLVGMGNLGQAFAWALGSLPYADPREVSLVLQDFDRVNDENWGTSVLVPDGEFGGLKTKLVENWLDRRGFGVRRIDRRLRQSDRLDDGDPRLAFSGLDKNAARRAMAWVGFEAIVDAGLGRTANDFDRFRVTVLHGSRTAATYFADMTDPPAPDASEIERYKDLAGVDRCGAAEIAGASVAVPYVSAIATSIAVARMIALVSSQPVIPSTSRRTGAGQVRQSTSSEQYDCRSLLHAGRPSPSAYRRPLSS